MNDRDLRHLLPVLDRVEAAPPDLVERLWSELEGVLGPEEDTVRLAYIESNTARDRRRRLTTRVVPIAAAVVLLVGIAVVSLVRGPSTEEVDPGVADLPSVDSVPATAPPTSAAPDPAPQTVSEACLGFRNAVADAAIESIGSPTPDDLRAIQAWVDGLGVLLSDLDRIGLPDDVPEQVLPLQLLRTALRSSIDGIEAGDSDAAATALENASRHGQTVRAGGPPLSDCLPSGA